jgi:phenylpyruvate decarboxylase
MLQHPTDISVSQQLKTDANQKIIDDVRLNISTKSEVTISEYIFQRIFQLGVKSIFGVPGDFNLKFLEHIYDVPGINWIGCCNELNASYAADAYAKASKKIGVLLTTYGVGELSALNGVAGAYTEFAPLLHLVGTSALKFKRNPNTVNLHHLAGNEKTWKKSDHYKYERIASEFSVDSASIEDDPHKACEMIDRVILNVWRHSRPGYIFLPCDLSEMKIDIKRLAQPIELSYEITNPISKINETVDKIISKIYNANNISIIVDDFIRKFRMENEFNLLLEKFDNKVNIFSTVFAKGLVNEKHPRFVGTYFGKYEAPVAKLLEQSDLVLHIGKFDNEINCGMFTSNLKKEKLIDFSAQYIEIGNEFDETITMMEVLPRLAEKLESSKISAAPVYEKPSKYYELDTNKAKEYALEEVDIIESLNENIRENDILIVETCSFLFAVPDIKIKNARLILQAYWASIGYALPATLGASLALRDFNLPGKVITIEGDGSAQMSLQELSSMLRYDIDATMIILNNSGYTIERVIIGPYSSYNDINTNWQWGDMMRTFGDVTKEKSESYKIESSEKLNQVLGDDNIYNNGKFKFLELILPMFDVPKKLSDLFP